MLARRRSNQVTFAIPDKMTDIIFIIILVDTIKSVETIRGNFISPVLETFQKSSNYFPIVRNYV